MEIPVDLIIAFLAGLIIPLAALIFQYLNTNYAKQQLTATAITQAITQLEQAETLQALYELAEQKKYSEWSKEDKEAAIKASRAFDILGILDSSGQVSRKFVDRFYAIPALDIYNICKDFIEDQRKITGKCYFWEFEQLANRVKYVKGNHPVRTGKNNWPRNPRHKYSFTNTENRMKELILTKNCCQRPPIGHWK